MTLELTKKKAIEITQETKVKAIIEYENKYYVFFHPVADVPFSFDSTIVSIDKDTEDYEYLLFYMLPDEVIAKYRNEKLN